MNDDLVGWLIEIGLDNGNLPHLVNGFCERLNEAGFNLKRVAIGSELLHPLHFGMSVIWSRDHGAVEEYYSNELGEEEDDDDEAWSRSPFFRMLQSGETLMHEPLNASHERGDIPLLDRFQDEGATDYLAALTHYGAEAILGQTEGIASSFLTDRPSGFTADQVQSLKQLVKPLALAFKAISTVTTGRTVIRTYLGDDAATRVLDGDIRRGRAETVDAVLWFSDLAGFTRIADATPRDRLMAFLNAYTELSVDAVHQHGGQVLKFMGDGVLGMFPRADNPRACDMALDAANSLISGLDLLNTERQAQGLTTTDIRLGLHRGDVLYGNIGSSERLDFTVIGPAVNEVSRIEGMCRALDQRIVVSSAFATSDTVTPGRLVSLGRYALRGVARPQELFTLEPESVARQSAEKQAK